MMTNETPSGVNEEKPMSEVSANGGTIENLQQPLEQNGILSFMNWRSLREYEQNKLEAIGELNEEVMMNVDQWLMNADRIYKELDYPPTSRVYQTTTYLQLSEKMWYDREKMNIHDNWEIFCQKLREHIHNRKQHNPTIPAEESIRSSIHETNLFEQSINRTFVKYDGKSDGQTWLLTVMNLFKQYEMSSQDRLRAIPILLEDIAYIWYIRNQQSIKNFECFTKLFLQQFGKIPTAHSSVDNSSLTTNLSMTMAREIIKTPTYFRGSKDDVVSWLEKLEVRFTMANWDDENKLRYIPIHLQEDAYRWWTQASGNIKTWSMFVNSITRAFGSSRHQELAFEQLQRYKQSINQSITQYYDKVLELCRRADATMTETMKLRYLMAGVKESLKFHIALHDPKTLESFLDYAKKVEDIMSITKINSMSDHELDHEFINAIRQTPTTKEFHPSTENQKSETVTHYFKQNDKKDVQHHSHRRFPVHNDRSSNKSNRKSIICYSCGTPGHYARECARSHFE